MSMLLPRAKTKLENFLPHVMAMVQGDSRDGLPAAVALSYIRNAAISFATKSHVLNRTDTIPFQENLSIYPLIDCKDDERVYMVRWVKQNDCRLLVEEFTDECVHLCKVPRECGTEFEVKYTVVPTRKACQVDSLLYDEWHDAIVAGALSSIHLMPQQPWTSGSASREQKSIFEQEVGRAKMIEFKKGHTGASKVQANQGYFSSGRGLASRGGW